MKKRFIFALALMAAMFLGGLICEGTTLAQNSNSSTTMGNKNSNSTMGGRRHRRGRRRHRRGPKMPKNSNT